MRVIKITSNSIITEDDISAYDLVLIEEPSKSAQRIANLICKDPNSIYVKNRLNTTLINILGENIC